MVPERSAEDPAALAGIARVVYWNSAKGFGFLRPLLPALPATQDAAPASELVPAVCHGEPAPEHEPETALDDAAHDLFVHQSVVVSDGFRELVLGGLCHFEGCVDDVGRWRATTCKPMSDDDDRSGYSPLQLLQGASKTRAWHLGDLCWCDTPQERGASRLYKGPCTVIAVNGSVIGVRTPKGAEWTLSASNLLLYAPHPDGLVSWVNEVTGDRYQPADCRQTTTKVVLPPPADVACASQDLNRCKYHRAASVVQEPVLVFIFCVSGPMCDQPAGSGLPSSWTEPDAAHCWRRDALVRCIAAALWEKTAAEGWHESRGEQRAQDTTNPNVRNRANARPVATVHADVKVCLLWPDACSNDEDLEATNVETAAVDSASNHCRVWLDMRFATEACCGHALELVILRQLDYACRIAFAADSAESKKRVKQEKHENGVDEADELLSPLPGVTVRCSVESTLQKTKQGEDCTDSHSTSNTDKCSGDVDPSIDQLAKAVIDDGCLLWSLSPSRTIVAALHETSPHCILTSQEQEWLPDHTQHQQHTTEGDGTATRNAKDSTTAQMTCTDLSHSSIFVLGCVDDHVNTVDAILAAAKRSGYQTVHVRVGCVPEFSSKVVHAVHSLHSQGSLSTALVQAVAGERRCTSAPTQVPASASGVVRATRIPREMPSALPQPAAGSCGLHFWVFCEWLLASECLPTSSTAVKGTPILLRNGVKEGEGSYALRSRSALLSNVVLAALARSHGTREDTRLTFVFGDDVVLTVDGPSLIGQHLGRRGYGALTEHHVLCGLADALITERQHGTRKGHLKSHHGTRSYGTYGFAEAWSRWATTMAHNIYHKRRRERERQQQQFRARSSACDNQTDIVVTKQSEQNIRSFSSPLDDSRIIVVEASGTQVNVIPSSHGFRNSTAMCAAESATVSAESVSEASSHTCSCTGCTCKRNGDSSYAYQQAKLVHVVLGLEKMSDFQGIMASSQGIPSRCPLRQAVVSAEASSTTACDISSRAHSLGGLSILRAIVTAHNLNDLGDLLS